MPHRWRVSNLGWKEFRRVRRSEFDNDEFRGRIPSKLKYTEVPGPCLNPFCHRVRHVFRTHSKYPVTNKYCCLVMTCQKSSSMCKRCTELSMLSTCRQCLSKKMGDCLSRSSGALSAEFEVNNSTVYRQSHREELSWPNIFLFNAASSTTLKVN